MSKKILSFFSSIAVLLVLVGYVFWQHIGGSLSPSLPSPPPASGSAVLGVQTKLKNCSIQNAFPDPGCTPGAIFADVTKDEICTSGYSKTVRNVPVAEKDDVYAEYGITSHQPGEYEVDHFISLELGGSNDIANLWPEPASPKPGFHEKDLVENFLHDQVCSGKISLSTAQTEIRTNWLAVYQQNQNQLQNFAY